MQATDCSFKKLTIKESMKSPLLLRSIPWTIIICEFFFVNANTTGPNGHVVFSTKYHEGKTQSDVRTLVVNHNIEKGLQSFLTPASLTMANNFSDSLMRNEDNRLKPMHQQLAPPFGPVPTAIPPTLRPGISSNTHDNKFVNTIAMQKMKYIPHQNSEFEVSKKIAEAKNFSSSTGRSSKTRKLEKQTCIDDDKYRFMSYPRRNCRSWVSGQMTQRCKFYDAVNNIKVEKACPLTCNKCDSFNEANTKSIPLKSFVFFFDLNVIVDKTIDVSSFKDLIARVSEMFLTNFFPKIVGIDSKSLIIKVTNYVDPLIDNFCKNVSKIFVVVTFSSSSYIKEDVIKKKILQSFEENMEIFIEIYLSMLGNVENVSVSDSIDRTENCSIEYTSMGPSFTPSKQQFPNGEQQIEVHSDLSMSTLIVDPSPKMSRPAMLLSPRPTTPIIEPLQSPTPLPATTPTQIPRSEPTNSLNSVPSKSSHTPSTILSADPSALPSLYPTKYPTGLPTNISSDHPSFIPSSKPSDLPSRIPSILPSGKPSYYPSSTPSDVPIYRPSSSPSGYPFYQPSFSPSDDPSNHPSSSPSESPSSLSSIPSGIPSYDPSSKPIDSLSYHPSSSPSEGPSYNPHSSPRYRPSHRPSYSPSVSPSHQPSGSPRDDPSHHPSFIPSSTPSTYPSSTPSQTPSVYPSPNPSSKPIHSPTLLPSHLPTSYPSLLPSFTLSAFPSIPPSIDNAVEVELYMVIEGLRQIKPFDRLIITAASQQFLINYMPDYLNTNSAFVFVQLKKVNYLLKNDYDSERLILTLVVKYIFPAGSTEDPLFLKKRTISTFAKYNKVYITQHLGSLSGRIKSLFVNDSIEEPIPDSTSMPSTTPSSLPSNYPSIYPSTIPSLKPSTNPPSILPSSLSLYPSEPPTKRFSLNPTSIPINLPSNMPTTNPTVSPSQPPTLVLTKFPTINPTFVPSKSPFSDPSFVPSLLPTPSSSLIPSFFPSNIPSSIPTKVLSTHPTHIPSYYPSFYPSKNPSFKPSIFPSYFLTQYPSASPSIVPTNLPSMTPTSDIVFDLDLYMVMNGLKYVKPFDRLIITATTQQFLINRSHHYIQEKSALIFVFVKELNYHLNENNDDSLVIKLHIKYVFPPNSVVDLFLLKKLTIFTFAKHNKEYVNTYLSAISQKVSSVFINDSLDKPHSHFADTYFPSSFPSNLPSFEPSFVLTKVPSFDPTQFPSFFPSRFQTMQPTFIPSWNPSYFPTMKPTNILTAIPSWRPSHIPSFTHSVEPSVHPSQNPSTKIPTKVPFAVDVPSRPPSKNPTSIPSRGPSVTPTYPRTLSPSGAPIVLLSKQPSNHPTNIPTGAPTQKPSRGPSQSPSFLPSSYPSSSPSYEPSYPPSLSPSHLPTVYPIVMPSDYPSLSPSEIPSNIPSNLPSQTPTLYPSFIPSDDPSSIPSEEPSTNPSLLPSHVPSANPTQSPSFDPSHLPSAVPTSDVLIEFKLYMVLTGIQYMRPYDQLVFTAATERFLINSSTIYLQEHLGSVFVVLKEIYAGNNDTRKNLGLTFHVRYIFPPGISVQPSDMKQMTLETFSKYNSEYTELYLSLVSDHIISTYVSDSINQPSDSPSLIPYTASNSPTFLAGLSIALSVSSGNPSNAPNKYPSKGPSRDPSQNPSSIPSQFPTDFPTKFSLVPTELPSTNPSEWPTPTPSAKASNFPSLNPSGAPSVYPSTIPSYIPSNVPTYIPSDRPSSEPSNVPSSFPSQSPSKMPTRSPSLTPTTFPSSYPSSAPSNIPTLLPSNNPSISPSFVPSTTPTSLPNTTPSTQPSQNPSNIPSIIPSEQPSQDPSNIPSIAPSTTPTILPTMTPSLYPSSFPSHSPTSFPSILPSSVPSHYTTYTTSDVHFRFKLLPVKKNLSSVELNAFNEIVDNFFATIIIEITNRNYATMKFSTVVLNQEVHVDPHTSKSEERFLLLDVRKNLTFNVYATNDEDTDSISYTNVLGNMADRILENDIFMQMLVEKIKESHNEVLGKVKSINIILASHLDDSGPELYVLPQKLGLKQNASYFLKVASLTIISICVGFFVVFFVWKKSRTEHINSCDISLPGNTYSPTFKKKGPLSEVSPYDNYVDNMYTHQEDTFTPNHTNTLFVPSDDTYEDSPINTQEKKKSLARSASGYSRSSDDSDFMSRRNNLFSSRTNKFKSSNSVNTEKISNRTKKDTHQDRVISSDTIEGNSKLSPKNQTIASTEESCNKYARSNGSSHGILYSAAKKLFKKKKESNIGLKNNINININLEGEEQSIDGSGSDMSEEKVNVPPDLKTDKGLISHYLKKKKNLEISTSFATEKLSNTKQQGKFKQEENEESIANEGKEIYQEHIEDLENRRSPKHKAPDSKKANEIKLPKNVNFSEQVVFNQTPQSVHNENTNEPYEDIDTVNDTDEPNLFGSMANQFMTSIHDNIASGSAFVQVYMHNNSVPCNQNDLHESDSLERFNGHDKSAFKQVSGNKNSLSQNLPMSPITTARCSSRQSFDITGQTIDFASIDEDDCCPFDSPAIIYHHRNEYQQEQKQRHEQNQQKVMSKKYGLRKETLNGITQGVVRKSPVLLPQNTDRDSSNTKYKKDLTTVSGLETVSFSDVETNECIPIVDCYIPRDRDRSNTSPALYTPNNIDRYREELAQKFSDGSSSESFASDSFQDREFDSISFDDIFLNTVSSSSSSDKDDSPRHRSCMKRSRFPDSPSRDLVPQPKLSRMREGGYSQKRYCHDIISDQSANITASVSMMSLLVSSTSGSFYLAEGAGGDYDMRDAIRDTIDKVDHDDDNDEDDNDNDDGDEDDDDDNDDGDDCGEYDNEEEDADVDEVVHEDGNKGEGEEEDREDQSLSTVESSKT